MSVAGSHICGLDLDLTLKVPRAKNYWFELLDGATKKVT